MTTSTTRVPIPTRASAVSAVVVVVVVGGGPKESSRGPVIQITFIIRSFHFPVSIRIRFRRDRRDISLLYTSDIIRNRKRAHQNILVTRGVNGPENRRKDFLPSTAPENV